MWQTRWTERRGDQDFYCQLSTVEKSQVWRHRSSLTACRPLRSTVGKGKFELLSSHRLHIETVYTHTKAFLWRTLSTWQRPMPIDPSSALSLTSHIHTPQCNQDCCRAHVYKWTERLHESHLSQICQWPSRLTAKSKYGWRIKTTVEEFAKWKKLHYGKPLKGLWESFGTLRSLCEE